VHGGEERHDEEQQQVEVGLGAGERDEHNDERDKTARPQVEQCPAATRREPASPGDDHHAGVGRGGRGGQGDQCAVTASGQVERQAGEHGSDR
jgi:hypothetical protein